MLSLLWTWGKEDREAARPLKQLCHEGISNVVAVSNLINIDLFRVRSTLKKELNQLPSQTSNSHVLHPRDTKGAGHTHCSLALLPEVEERSENGRSCTLTDSLFDTTGNYTLPQPSPKVCLCL